MANVIFKQGTRAQYDAIAVKDASTLYWLTDTQELFKGEVLYGRGTEATALASGLMSAADKAKLDALSTGGISGLTAVDASIILSTDESGTTIGVRVSEEADNALTVKDDGMYVPATSGATAIEFELERQAAATEGYSATYKLKRIDGESVSYVGDEINIPKDMVLQSGTLETVTEADSPYTGASVGDPYIDLVLNDADSTHIYVPVKGIVDISNKVDQVITNADGGQAIIINEPTGGGAKYWHPDGSQAFVGVNDGGLDGLMAQIYADKEVDGKWVGSRINVYHDHIYYTSLADKEAGKANNDADCEIATKGDLASITASVAWQEM